MRVANFLLVAKSQILIRLSSDPVARYFPLGEKDKEVTDPMCPKKIRIGCPEETSQSLADLSVDPVAT